LASTVWFPIYTLSLRSNNFSSRLFFKFTINILQLYELSSGLIQLVVVVNYYYCLFFYCGSVWGEGQAGGEEEQEWEKIISTYWLQKISFLGGRLSCNYWLGLSHIFYLDNFLLEWLFDSFFRGTELNDDISSYFTHFLSYPDLKYFEVTIWTMKCEICIFIHWSPCEYVVVMFLGVSLARVNFMIDSRRSTRMTVMEF
jgi:hypothetical protein